jgi:hypothetical protein
MGVDSRQIFTFSKTSRLALGPIQPDIQWVQGVPSSEVKGPGSEADHSAASSAGVEYA